MTGQPLDPAALADIRKRDLRGIDDPQRVAQDREVLLVEVDRLAAEVTRLQEQERRVRAWGKEQALPWADGVPDREGEEVYEGLLAALDGDQPKPGDERHRWHQDGPDPDDWKCAECGRRDCPIISPPSEGAADQPHACSYCEAARARPCTCAGPRHDPSNFTCPRYTR